MALTYRQRATILDDLQADAAGIAAKLTELAAYLEQLRARIENARWGDNPTEQRRDRWVKVQDKATYKPKAKR